MSHPITPLTQASLHRSPTGRGLFAAGVVAILALIMAAGAQGATSFETVKDFAPLIPTNPNPPSWPEDVQLGGVSQMAVNETGAGGVAPGTVYTVGSVVGEPGHVARYSAEGVFELGWTTHSHCGPKALPPSTCPAYPSGTSGRTGIAINQTTGIVYVFLSPGTPELVHMYLSDGTPFGIPFGEQDTSGTASSSPSKLHFSPLNENIAVDSTGALYLADEDTTTDQYHRIMVFRPENSGDFEHYEYAGQGRDIGAGFLPSHPPARPHVDNAGHIFAAGEGYILEYDPVHPATPTCELTVPTGGITSIAVNPVTGAVFYFTSKPKPLIHQLNPCNADGTFTEAGPSFRVDHPRGSIEGMVFNPAVEFTAKGTVAASPAGAGFERGALYAGAGTNCPATEGCPAEAQGQSSLGYILAPQLTPQAPRVGTTAVKSVSATVATVAASVDPEGPTSSYTVQYLPESTYEENGHVDEQQSISVTASKGTFRLSIEPESFEGEETAAIDFNAPASAVQGALEELVGVGKGNVTVGGGPGGLGEASPYVVTFVRGLGEADLPELVADGAKLKGSGASVTVSTLRAGTNGFLGASETPSPPVPAGSGRQPISVEGTIAGLVPAESYRYRVLASNKCKPKSEMTCKRSGEAGRFQTLATGSSTLADGRAFELVSPVDKNGGEVLPSEPLYARCGPECEPGLAAPRFPVAVSPSGDGLAYQGQPFVPNEGAIEYDEYVSSRSRSGWSTVSMSPPLKGEGATGGQQFRTYAVEQNLARGITFATNSALTPGAPAGYANLFNEPVGNRLSLEPIYTKASPSRPRGGSEGLAIRYVGSSADFSRIFFEANEALTNQTDDAPEAVEGDAADFNLYEWDAGQIRLVNIQPGNLATHPEAAFGGGSVLANPSYVISNFSHAISASGARVFWTDSASGALYVRENATETKEVPTPDTCRAAVKFPVCFLSASADGSSVLLSNGTLYELGTGVSNDLTDGDGVFEGLAGQSDDLSHLYFVLGPVAGNGTLAEGSDVVSSVSSTNGAFKVGQSISGQGIPAGSRIVAVEGSTLELSAPATANASVSLLAQAPLAEGSTNSEGVSPDPRGENLYAWQGGAVSFIATLAETDSGELGIREAAPVRRRAEASPNGRWLAFNSAAPLTGANTVGPCIWNAVAGKYSGSNQCPEVFLYDSTTGTLSCPSCSSTGAEPLGLSLLGRLESPIGYLPQPQFVTDNGRLYFESQDKLSSQDLNIGVEDVYQYEPSGVGSCSGTGGCVSLISSGTGIYDSSFLATDPSGNNVFFTTRLRLVPADLDSLIDVYDARVGGGIPADEASSPSPCNGEGCQPSTIPPLNESLPGTAAVEASSNVSSHKTKKKTHRHHKKLKKKHRTVHHKKPTKQGKGSAK